MDWMCALHDVIVAKVLVIVMEVASEITGLDMHLSGLRDSQAGLFAEIERIAAGKFHQIEPLVPI